MIKKVFMGEYYILGTLGLARTIARARNCETDKQMIMFTTVDEGGFAGENLLWDESEFIKVAQES